MKTKKLLTSVICNTSSMPYIDFKFDEGSASSYTIIDSTIPTIRITPVKHWASQWAWWAIRSREWKGLTPHFKIAKASHYSFEISEKLCQWSTSADTDDWHLFDNQTDDGTDLNFYNDTPFPGGVIYISALPMYPLSRIARKVAEWLGNPLVTDTESGSAGVVGYSTPRLIPDGSGRVCPALPYYGFKVTSGSGNKNKAIITSFSHPSETHGPYQMEGAINWLLGGSTEANYFLNYFDFYVYPCINPQGVWGGWFRSSPQAPTDDHNRVWDTSGSYEDVDKLKAIWLVDTGSAIEATLDFHGWMSSGGTPFLTSTSVALPYPNELYNKILTFRSNYGVLDSDLPTSLKAYQEGTCDALLAVAPEIAGAMTISASTYKDIGRDVFRGFEMMNREGWFPNSPSVASRSFNGSSDRIDWASIGNISGCPITISAWVSGSDAGTASDYILHLTPSSASTAFGTVFYVYSTSTIGFIRGGTGNYLWRTGAKTWVNNWNHLLVTHDGTQDSTKIHIYQNNAEVSTYANDQNGTDQYLTTGSVSIGGRIYDDTRCFNGKIANVALWNRVLTSTEIANLSAGHTPDVAAPDNLLFYFKGNTSSLVATPGGTGIADGTTFVSGSAGNGPGIMY